MIYKGNHSPIDIYNPLSLEANRKYLLFMTSLVSPSSSKSLQTTMYNVDITCFLLWLFLMVEGLIQALMAMWLAYRLACGCPGCHQQSWDMPFMGIYSASLSISKCLPISWFCKSPADCTFLLRSISLRRRTPSQVLSDLQIKMVKWCFWEDNIFT